MRICLPERVFCGWYTVERLQFQLELNKVHKKTIDIAMPSMVCSSYYTMIYGFFQRRFPGIQLRISDLPSDEVIRKVVQEEIDFGFGIVRSPVEEVDVAPVGQGRYLFVLNSSHPLCQKEELTLSDLQNERIFISNEAARVRAILKALSNRQKGMLTIDDSVDENGAILNLVSQDLGIGLLPETESAVVLNNRQISVRRFSSSLDLTYQIGLFYKKGGVISDEAGELIAHLKSSTLN